MRNSKPEKRLLYLAFLLLLITLGCFKQEGELIIDPPGATVGSGVILKDRTHIIDSTSLDLISDATALGNGIYQFALAGNSPQIRAGDVIVGDQGLGFLRKVSAVRTGPNELTLTTTQASLEDLIASGDLNFELDLSGSSQYKNLDLQYDLFDLNLYDKKGVTIGANGSIEFESDFKLDLSFSSDGLERLDFETDNAHVKSTLKLTAEAKQALSLIEEQTTLAGFKKIVTVYIPVGAIKLPVKIELTTDFILKYAAALEAKVNTWVTFTNNNRLEASLRYEDQDWSVSYELSPAYDLEWTPLNGATEATVNLELVPVFSAKIYGVVGPYLSVGLKEHLLGQVASPSLDWDFSASCWVETTTGIRAMIFGDQLFDFNRTWTSEPLTYRTPFSLRKASGDDQFGSVNTSLKDPIRVQVRDEFDRPQSKVPVYFEVNKGGGSISPESILTDEDGFAETYWTLGPDADKTNKLEVSVKKADGEEIESAPVSFTATAEAAETDPNLLGTWLVVLSSQINCPSVGDNYVVTANNSGFICFDADCSRTLWEFTDTTIIERITYTDGTTDQETYNYTLLDKQTLEVCTAGDCNPYGFSVVDDELEITAPDGDCTERTVAIRQ